MIHIINFFYLVIVYRMQKRGTCTSISEKECEQYKTSVNAKTFLRGSWNYRVKGCYNKLSNDQVCFNTYSSSTILCTDERPCVCKQGKLNVVGDCSLLYWGGSHLFYLLFQLY